MKQLSITFFIMFAWSVVYAQTWQQVPKRMQAQETAGLSGGEGWQLISGIAYAPTDPNIAYFVTDTNQVWKSIDGGTSWQRKGNGFYANGGASLVVDPTNPNIVYVAGSEMSASGSTPISEQHDAEGIFRTTDGGDNWTRVKDAHFHRYQAQGGIHFAFADSTIYAAQSEGGLLKSTNGGTTWNLVNKSGGGYVLDNHSGLFDIKAHPASTAGSATCFVSTGLGLYRVVDNNGSATVTPIGTGLPHFSYQIAYGTSTPNTIYAAAGTYGVFRSTDGGLNFSARNNGLSTPISMGGRAKNIALCPVNGNKLFVTFLGLWPTKQLYYTNDGGANWTLTTTMDEQNADGWVCSSEFADGSGRWTQDKSGSGEWAAPIAFHPTVENTALVEGHGDIVRKTVNGGSLWKYSNTGYTGASGLVNALSTFAWDRINPSIFVSAHMDFGPMLTTDGESTFMSIGNTTPSGSPGGAVRDNIIVRIIGNWTNIANFKLGVSRDSGSSTTAISGTEGTSTQWTNEWQTQLVSFHPQNDNIVYAGKYRFDNIGTSNVFVTLSKPVYGMFRGNGDIVYSFSGSTIYKSTNKGGTWTTPYPSLNIPSGFNAYQIAIDPVSENRIYVAVRSKGIYIINNTTANGGTAVLKNDANGIAKSRYDKEDINSVAVDPNLNIYGTTTIYAGAYASWYGHSNGVFRSTDAGLTWTNINGNLGSDINIQGISVNPHNSYVYIASFAGTWKLPPLGESGTGTPGASPTVVTGTATVVTITTATLHSEINPNGSSTTCRWQYGTATGNYTTNTGSQTVGAGTSSVGMQQAITGLTGSTTYYVRAQANSFNGSTNGSETTFTTNQRLSLNVSMGTPTVNGNLSEWAAINNLVSVVISGTVTSATGTWAAKWNATGLHFAFTGSDTTDYVDSGNTNVHNDDGFEVYVNRDGNLESTTYDGYDYHLGWNRHGTFTRAYNGTNTGIVVGTASASGGYIMEVTIPWSVFPGGNIPGSGTVIGADVQFNDDTDGGSRNCARNWNAETGGDTDYFNPSSFGQFVLQGEGGGGSAPGTSTVYITEDTYVNSAATTTNYGTNTTVGVRNGSVGFVRQGLFEADIGNPGSITAVKLYVYGTMTATVNINYSIFGVNAGSWTENVVTWNTKPATQTTALDTKTVTKNVSAWYNFDLTNYAQTLGSTTISLMLAGDPPTTGTILYVNSRENGTGAPYLLVSYDGGAGSDTASPVGTITINSNGTYTTLTGVTLNLSATDDIGVEGYYLSGSTTTPTAEQAGWASVGTVTPYSANIPYTLSYGDGTKTVYVWYKDGVPNVSAIASDSIILDLTYPSINIVSPSSIYTMTDGGKAFGTTAASVTISGSSTDTNGIVSVSVANSATTTTWTATGTNTFTTTRKILPVLSDGLVGYWKLDEISGSIAYDSSPLFTTNGSIAGASVGTLSVFGGSRYFDGVDDYISMDDPVDGHLDFGTSSFSFGCLAFVISNKGSYDTILWKGGIDTIGGYSFSLGSGGWHCRLSGATGTANILIESGIYNQWVQIYTVIDQESDVTKVFLNGVQTGTDTTFASFGSLNSSYSFGLGANQYGGSLFNGYLDDVRIYNRALSNAEVLQLYQLTTPDQVNTFSLTAQDTPGNQGTDIVSVGAFPAISTVAATSITRNSVTLNGIVSANNNSTTTWFDYGLVSGYYTGSSTTGTVTGAVDTSVAISLGALASETTFYYRIAATNAVGTTYGSEFSFDTLSARKAINNITDYSGEINMRNTLDLGNIENIYIYSRN